MVNNVYGPSIFFIEGMYFMKIVLDIADDCSFANKEYLRLKLQNIFDVSLQLR